MKFLAVAISVLACIATVARADDHGPPPPHGDPIHDKLFPPELIMGHQQELGIDAKQREAMIRDIERTQAQVTELSWKLTAGAEELGKMLDVAQVDEAKVLAQLDKVTRIEAEIKKAHLALLVRIKNGLTDAQRAKLVELRKHLGGGPPPHP